MAFAWSALCLYGLSDLYDFDSGHGIHDAVEPQLRAHQEIAKRHFILGLAPPTIYNLIRRKPHLAALLQLQPGLILANEFGFGFGRAGEVAAFLELWHSKNSDFPRVSKPWAFSLGQGF